MKLFIGFDIQNKNIKLMSAERSTDPAKVELLRFNSRIFTDDFFVETKELLQAFLSANPSFANVPCYVILPDAAVGFETFNIPNMNRIKMMRAFEAELINLYEGAYRDKKINRFQLVKNKQTTTFAALYYDKKVVSRLHALLSEVKLVPKFTTYSGNAAMNCVYALAPKTRGKSFIFADVHSDYTEITVSSAGTTLGTAIVPHGTDILKTDEVISEYMETNHDIGEIAVINAREVARARALTLAGDPSVIPENATIDDYAVDSEEQKRKYAGIEEETAREPEVSENAGADAEEQTDGNMTDSTAETVVETEVEEDTETEVETETETGTGTDTEIEAADVEFYESEEEEQKRLTELAKTKVKKIKVFRKAPKRYPRFMQREQPETPEGIQYENWRVIEKWILLYARSARLSEYTASPEFILVNMPQQLYYLLDKSNEGLSETAIKFQPFAAADSLTTELKENLNLYGGIYADHYNKNHNY